MCVCIVCCVCAPLRESDHGLMYIIKDSISKLQVPHDIEDMPGVWHISVAVMHIFECNRVALIFHSMQYLHSQMWLLLFTYSYI